ncbi:putative E3 ubiquitin-protein ligase HECW1 [Apostichopus japonicus]|uniref:Putative E3 ubiquitin-protein ligase HECW1 n=1 Tax=Stichopus japonicus TaxID=307972 RepID=A0A2G8K9Z0_STIJA|nr:putative E3 ubiquitin-protein ligase HECW1 [Apostichopus japonicus]
MASAEYGRTASSTPHSPIQDRLGLFHGTSSSHVNPAFWRVGRLSVHDRSNSDSSLARPELMNRSKLTVSKHDITLSEDGGSSVIIYWDIKEAVAPNDWIGLYHIGETNPSEYLSYKNRGVSGTSKGQIVWVIEPEAYFDRAVTKACFKYYHGPTASLLAMTPTVTIRNPFAQEQEQNSDEEDPIKVLSSCYQSVFSLETQGSGSLTVAYLRPYPCLDFCQKEHMMYNRQQYECQWVQVEFQSTIGRVLSTSFLVPKVTVKFDRSSSSVGMKAESLKKGMFFNPIPTSKCRSILARRGSSGDFRAVTWSANNTRGPRYEATRVCQSGIARRVLVMIPIALQEFQFTVTPTDVLELEVKDKFAKSRPIISRFLGRVSVPIQRLLEKVALGEHTVSYPLGKRHPTDHINGVLTFTMNFEELPHTSHHHHRALGGCQSQQDTAGQRRRRRPTDPILTNPISQEQLNLVTQEAQDRGQTLADVENILCQDVLDVNNTQVNGSPSQTTSPPIPTSLHLDLPNSESNGGPTVNGQEEEEDEEEEEEEDEKMKRDPTKFLSCKSLR